MLQLAGLLFLPDWSIFLQLHLDPFFHLLRKLQFLYPNALDRSVLIQHLQNIGASSILQRVLGDIQNLKIFVFTNSFNYSEQDLLIQIAKPESELFEFSVEVEAVNNFARHFLIAVDSVIVGV